MGSGDFLGRLLPTQGCLPLRRNIQYRSTDMPFRCFHTGRCISNTGDGDTMLKSLKATLAGLAFLCAGAGQTALAQDYPSMTFRYATGYPEALYMNEPAKWFARELEERSGGKIKVRMFFG